MREQARPQASETREPGRFVKHLPTNENTTP